MSRPAGIVQTTLFRPEALREPLRGFTMPERIATLRPRLEAWAELIRSRRIDDHKEQSLLQDFETFMLGAVLGYRRPVDGPDYQLKYEVHVGSRVARADGSIGHYGADDRHLIAVEGKGPKDPLDRPYAGRTRSAVDQALGYAFDLNCDWFIVTNMVETRLYHQSRGRDRYERFETVRLAEDDKRLRRLVYLLGAERVCGAANHLDGLLAASDTVGREVTAEYYRRYADIRREMLAALRVENPSVEPAVILEKTQRLLDRVLFIAFCEDRGLLPGNTIQRAFEHADPYHPRPVWDNFRGLFGAVDQGSERLGISRFNGGLFAPDAVLDALMVPDLVCRRFASLAEYEYRAPAMDDAEDDGLPTLVDVEILGHVFEQSIDDLENLRREVVGTDDAPVRSGKQKTRRRKEGAFYTPEFVTDAIIARSLGRVVADRFESLRHTHHVAAPDRSRKLLQDPRAYDAESLQPLQRQTLAAFWQAWEQSLMNVRVADPACGSGAFLVAAFDYLYAAYAEADRHLRVLTDQRLPFDIDREILRRNLYGVDLNGEAVEVCQLSLWIKTASRGKELAKLDDRVRRGNSLIADAEVPLAFDWHAAFPEAFAGYADHGGGGGGGGSMSSSATRRTYGRSGSGTRSRSCKRRTTATTASPTCTCTSSSVA